MKTFIAFLALSASPVAAATDGPMVAGMTNADARSLIAQLQQLQRQLREGTSDQFELLSGGTVSLPPARTPPVDMFLQIPFDQVQSITKRQVSTMERTNQINMFAFLAAQKLSCSIDVSTYQPNAKVRRVVINCSGPPPGLPPAPPASPKRN